MLTVAERVWWLHHDLELARGSGVRVLVVFRNWLTRVGACQCLAKERARAAACSEQNQGQACPILRDTASQHALAVQLGLKWNAPKVASLAEVQSLAGMPALLRCSAPQTARR